MRPAAARGMAAQRASSTGARGGRGDAWCPRSTCAPIRRAGIGAPQRAGEVCARAPCDVLSRDAAGGNIRARERLGAVHLGAAAELRSDSYPDKSYRGEVTFLASEAEFTPKNVQTQEERVRLVYAAKVRIVDDPRFELKPGLPVDVEIRLSPGKQ